MEEKQETSEPGRVETETMNKPKAIKACEMITCKAVVIEQACWSVLSGDSPVGVDGEGYGVIEGIRNILIEVAESAREVTTYLNEVLPPDSEPGGAV